MYRLRLVALLLTGVALAACSGSSEPNAVQLRAADKAISGDLDAQIRRVQILRTQGNYVEATRAISQLMIGVPDDPRVVGEYGKLLAQQGQAQDALAFLRRATELNTNDWTIYSAMGVAYDQLNDPNQARIAYDRALAMKPGDATVLNNYAMSRMLAKDLPQAARLIQQARATNSSDLKIQRNAELIASLMPPEPKPVMMQGPALAAAPQAAPVVPVSRVEAPKPVTAAPFPFVPFTSRPVAQPLAPVAPVATSGSRQPTSAPRPLQPQQMGASVSPQQTASVKPKANAQVMMQEVPFDPLAGPVAQAGEKPIKLKPPVKKTAIAKAEAPKAEKSKAAEPKIQVAKSETPVKAAPAKTEAPKAQVVKNDVKPEAKPAKAPKPENKPASKPAKTQFAESEPKPSADSIPRLRMAADSD